MVKDNEIKAEVSPFSMREGEIKVFDGKDGYVSMNQIVHKIDIGHIGDIHFKALDLINEFEFMTSRQMYQMLLLKGIDPKGQDKLNNKLEQLVKSKILSRYYFSSEEGKGIFRVYCMDKMGKYLLNSREIDTNWQMSDNIKPVETIKKRLSGNQTIIAYLTKVKAFEKYTVKPVITAKLSAKTFKTAGGAVKLKKGTKSVEFLFEAIRRDDNWEEKLVERMRWYKDFYENFVAGDSGFLVAPQFILICEDELHMKQVFKTVVTKQVEIQGVKIYYTTDLRQNKESLESTLVAFNLVDGKYKMEDVEVKLLGI